MTWHWIELQTLTSIAITRTFNSVFPQIMPVLQIIIILKIIVVKITLSKLFAAHEK